MHLCIAGSVRAMPEKENPPAMPVDYNMYESFAVVARVYEVLVMIRYVTKNTNMLYNVDVLPFTMNLLGKH